MLQRKMIISISFIYLFVVTSPNIHLKTYFRGDEETGEENGYLVPNTTISIEKVNVIRSQKKFKWIVIKIWALLLVPVLLFFVDVDIQAVLFFHIHCLMVMNIDSTFILFLKKGMRIFLLSDLYYLFAFQSD